MYSFWCNSSNKTAHKTYKTNDTVCPGSSDPFYIGSYYIKWATTSWTYSTSTYIYINTYISGQRSSSLHYAACFGRPGIAKVLLKHGANPDLRYGWQPFKRTRVMKKFCIKGIVWRTKPNVQCSGSLGNDYLWFVLHINWTVESLYFRLVRHISASR